MTVLYLILYWTVGIYDNFKLLVAAWNPLKHEYVDALQVVLFCASPLFTGHHNHFEYGCKTSF